MSEKIRLRNPQQFDVGIITIDKPYGLNIAPGAFTIVSKDDIDYLMATSTLLQRGILRVEGEQKEEVLEQMGVKEEDNANFMSDEDIKKKLSGNANQLRKWLDGDIEPFVLAKIAEIADGMNLNANKLQVLREKIPNHDFLK